MGLVSDRWPAGVWQIEIGNFVALPLLPVRIFHCFHLARPCRCALDPPLFSYAPALGRFPMYSSAVCLLLLISRRPKFPQLRPPYLLPPIPRLLSSSALALIPLLLILSTPMPLDLLSVPFALLSTLSFLSAWRLSRGWWFSVLVCSTLRV